MFNEWKAYVNEVPTIIKLPRNGCEPCKGLQEGTKVASVVAIYA